METWVHQGRKLTLHHGGITELQVDAIVTAANSSLAGGGGVDGAVHQAAGLELIEACQAIPRDSLGQRCPPGQARLTRGYRLCPWIIHSVGPIYDPSRDGRCAMVLASAHEVAFFLAGSRECRSVALPAISTGAFGYPPSKAAPVALRAALRHLSRDPFIREVLFALHDLTVYQAFEAHIESLDLDWERVSCP